MVPFAPATFPDLRSVAVWISAGKEDTIIPPAESARLAELLRQCGAEVALEYIDADHAPTMMDVAAAKGWLAAHRD